MAHTNYFKNIMLSGWGRGSETKDERPLKGGIPGGEAKARPPPTVRRPLLSEASTHFSSRFHGAAASVGNEMGVAKMLGLYFGFLVSHKYWGLAFLRQPQ